VFQKYIKKQINISVAAYTTVKDDDQHLTVKKYICKYHIWETLLQYVNIL